MKILKIVATIFILTISQNIIACDCISEGVFLTVAPKTDLIALVKVTKYLTFKDIYGKQTPTSMEVEIIDTYKGKETRKKIIVWGDNGALCRPYLSTFDIGKYYVIAFYKGSTPSEINANQDEKTTDYSISVCGDYWLFVDKNLQYAIGAVSKKERKLKLTELRRRLKNKL